jgi:hypothetical protein
VSECTLKLSHIAGTAREAKAHGTCPTGATFFRLRDIFKDPLLCIQAPHLLGREHLLQGHSRARWLPVEGLGTRPPQQPPQVGRQNVQRAAALLQRAPAAGPAPGAALSAQRLAPTPASLDLPCAGGGVSSPGRLPPASLLPRALVHHARAGSKQAGSSPRPVLRFTCLRLMRTPAGPAAPRSAPPAPPPPPSHCAGT